MKNTFGEKYLHISSTSSHSFPQQFATTTWKASFTFLPFDVQLIQKKHMELLGPINLIISGWECQGFSVVGFGEGLSDTRSNLSTDMIRLIT
jgi:site-specific DNA-cytosine methylase